MLSEAHGIFTLKIYVVVSCLFLAVFCLNKNKNNYLYYLQHNNPNKKKYIYIYIFSLYSSTNILKLAHELNMGETLGGEDASEANWCACMHIHNALTCNMQVLAQYIPCLVQGRSISFMSVGTKKLWAVEQNNEKPGLARLSKQVRQLR